MESQIKDIKQEQSTLKDEPERKRVKTTNHVDENSNFVVLVYQLFRLTSRKNICPDMMKTILSYITSDAPFIRLVCKRWAELVPKRCLLPSYAHTLVKILKENFIKQRDPDFEIIFKWYQAT